MSNEHRREDILLEERPLIELPALLKIFLVIIFLGLGLSLLIFPYYFVLAAYLGLIIAIGILFNPFIGAILFIAAAYLHPIQFMPELKYSNITTAAAFVIFLVWAFHILIYRDFKLPSSRQLFYFFCFALIATFSSALRWDESSFYYADLLKVFILYFLIANLAKTKKDIAVIVITLLILGLMTSVLAIYQSTHGIGLQMSGGILRVTGFSNDPNDLALSLLLLLPFAFGLLVRSQRLGVKAVYLTLFSIYLIVIGLTFSRAVYLGLPILIIISAWKFMEKGKRFLAIVTVSLIFSVGLFFLPQKVWQRIQTITMTELDPSIWSRLDGYIVGGKMMAEHPIVGVGIGRWRLEYWPVAFASPLVRTKSSSVQHNIFLEVGSETGFLGLFFFILLIICAFRDIRETRRIFDRLNEEMLAMFSQALEIGLIGFLISTMFVAAIHVKFFWIILGFMLALRGLALSLLAKKKEI